jgi:hypothetical protein
MLSTWLRGIGGLLEIVGVLTIVWELRSIGKIYPGRRGFFGGLWDRMPWRRRDAVARASGFALGVGTAHGVAVESWEDSWDTATKINKLRDRVTKLRERTDEAYKQIQKQAAEDRRKVGEQLDGVRAEVRDLDEKVGELTRGSIRIRGLGVAPLVLGIVLTTWPTEIAGWFGAS